MADRPPSLRQLLAAGYDDLRRRLTRRLGSAERANEALHETWIRLDPAHDTAAIARPLDYLFRAALNVATDGRRAERRRLDHSEVDAMYHVADAAIDGERVVEARSELAALERALQALTPRQRAIVIAVRVDRTSHAELARRFGISERMVDKDLRHALEHCADALDRGLVTRFGSRPPKSSTQ